MAKRKSKAPKPKTKVTVMRRSMDPLSKQYAELLMNPCGGKLVYPPSLGASESGYLVRLYRRYVFHGTGANNSGHFTWFPGFCGNNIAGFNAVHFETSNPDTSPTNTTVNPFGSGGIGGTSAPDPAGTWCSSSNVASARTVAACARVYYTGTLSNNSGTMAVVPTITPDQLLYGSVGNPVTPNSLITMAPVVTRIPLEAREVRWAPSTGDLTYKAIDRAGTGDINAPFKATGGAVTVPTPVSNGTNGVAISWSGLNTTGTNDFIIECIKVIEWLPDTNSIIQPMSNPRPRSTIGEILTWLDDTLPGWRDTFTHTTAQRIINTAQAGVGLYGTYIGMSARRRALQN